LRGLLLQLELRSRSRCSRTSLRFDTLVFHLADHTAQQHQLLLARIEAALHITQLLLCLLPAGACTRGVRNGQRRQFARCLGKLLAEPCEHVAHPTCLSVEAEQGFGCSAVRDELDMCAALLPADLLDGRVQGTTSLATATVFLGDENEVQVTHTFVRTCVKQNVPPIRLDICPCKADNLGRLAVVGVVQ